MIIVVGGGIAGLATAHALRRAGQPVTVLEAAPRVGGKIRSVREGGCLLEDGPDGFMAHKPAALDLVRELGLERALIAPRPMQRPTWLHASQGLQPLPPGLALGVPTRWMPVLRSPLLSWRGKLRLACEPFMRRGRAPDESLASFVQRRLGQEALTRLVGPLASGVYAADPRELSLQAAFPQLAAMERTHGSLTRAMLQQRQGQPRGGMLSFTDGMEQLVEGLRARLEVETGRRVLAVAPSRVKLEGSEVREVSAVVLAVPPPAMATLLRPHDAELARRLEEIPTSSATLVHLVYDAEQVRRPLDGHGWVSGLPGLHKVRACSVVSRKYPGRSPGGSVQLRAFLPGLRGEGIDPALEELTPLLGLHGSPRLARTVVHQGTMPWYRVGHRQLVEWVEERTERQHPGLFLTGSGLSGIGVADCIEQGEKTAQRVLRYLAG